MLDNIQTSHIQQPTPAVVNAQKNLNKEVEKNSQDFDFEDVLDIFNPLQHIPIVSSLYQEQTQDEISNDAKAVGDIFFGVLTGGVFGVLSAVGNAILKQETDKDVGEHLIAFVSGEDEGNASVDNEIANIQQQAAALADANSSNSSSSNSNNGESNNGVSNNKVNDSMSQKDDYWSIRMKQIFGDDDFG